MKSRIIAAGGGMNVLVYAGVDKARKELGIEVVASAGVSAGSIYATAIAAGYEGEELIQAMLQFVPVAQKAFDPSLLVKNHGVVEGKKLEGIISGMLAKKGVKRFKDTKIPLKLFTTNYDKCRQAEWSSAKTPDELIAPHNVDSCRIPGVFQGRVVDGDLHFDGGLWDNCPADCWNNELQSDEQLLVFLFKQGNNETTGANPYKFWKNPLKWLSFAKKIVGFWGGLVNLMIRSRVSKSLQDVPPGAHIIALPAADGLDFNIDEKKAATLVDMGYRAMMDWSKSVKLK